MRMHSLLLNSIPNSPIRILPQMGLTQHVPGYLRLMQKENLIFPKIIWSLEMRSIHRRMEKPFVSRSEQLLFRKQKLLSDTFPMKLYSYRRSQPMVPRKQYSATMLHLSMNRSTVAVLRSRNVTRRQRKQNHRAVLLWKVQNLPLPL